MFDLCVIHEYCIKIESEDVFRYHWDKVVVLIYYLKNENYFLELLETFYFSDFVVQNSVEIKNILSHSVCN